MSGKGGIKLGDNSIKSSHLKNSEKYGKKKKSTGSANSAILSNRLTSAGDFPGNPVVRTLHFYRRGTC